MKKNPRYFIQVWKSGDGKTIYNLYDRHNMKDYLPPLFGIVCVFNIYPK